MNAAMLCLSLLRYLLKRPGISALPNFKPVGSCCQDENLPACQFIGVFSSSDSSLARVEKYKKIQQSTSDIGPVTPWPWLLDHTAVNLAEYGRCDSVKWTRTLSLLPSHFELFTARFRRQIAPPPKKKNNNKKQTKTILDESSYMFVPQGTADTVVAPMVFSV